MLSSRPVALAGDGPSHQLYTKTPGRNMIKGRNTLQENAVYRGPKTINGKGKAAQTPFHHGVTKAVSGSVKPVVTVTVSRPLGDKTPFPNRQTNVVPLDTPAPQTTKISKLSLLDPSLEAPALLLRPSSARKSLRIPRSPGESATKQGPVTPVSQIQGPVWDFSDGEVSVAEASVEQVEEEDYDEIEYMPPTATVPKWEPDFEMPDYKVAGKALLELAQSYHFDDSADRYYAADIETQVDVQELWKTSGISSEWETLDLPALDDDSPFRSQAVASPESTTNVPTTRSAASGSTVRQAPAPASTSAARSIPYSLRTRPVISASNSAAPSRGSSSIPSTRPATSMSSIPEVRRTTRSTTNPARPATSSGARSTNMSTDTTRKAVVSKSKPAASTTTETSTAAAKRVAATSTSRSVTVPARAAPTLRGATTSSIPKTTTTTGRARATGSTSKTSSGSKVAPSHAAVTDDNPLILTFEHGVGDVEDFEFDV